MTERRVRSKTGGEKGIKPERMDLIPPDALLELARVYGSGANKYEDHNWVLGYDYSLAYGAMLRHIMRWSAGEEADPESGCHHLAHAAWHCLTLITYQQHGLGVDNRICHAIEESRKKHGHTP